ncbi:primosomal N domain protein [[Clostridium] sordellii ATCC 9714]|nr:primosomal N domain protein [[Clostridium] sordellii ATCC 9714] [Paeniclostridium sordellii ATCC 9714]
MISLSKQAEEIDVYLKENKIRLGSKQKEILEYIKNVKEIDLGKLLENTNATRQSINGLKEKIL